MTVVKNSVSSLTGVTDNITTINTLEVSSALETIRNTETFTDEFTNNIVKNLLSNVNETAQANAMLPQSKKAEIQEYVTSNSNSLDNNETTNKKNVRRKIVLSKFEKLLYSFALFLLVLAPLATVFSQATLSKVNYDDLKESGQLENYCIEIKPVENVLQIIDEVFEN